MHLARCRCHYRSCMHEPRLLSKRGGVLWVCFHSANNKNDKQAIMVGCMIVKSGALGRSPKHTSNQKTSCARGARGHQPQLTGHGKCVTCSKCGVAVTVTSHSTCMASLVCSSLCAMLCATPRYCTLATHYICTANCFVTLHELQWIVHTNAHNSPDTSTWVAHEIHKMLHRC